MTGKILSLSFLLPPNFLHVTYIYTFPPLQLSKIKSKQWLSQKNGALQLTIISAEDLSLTKTHLVKKNTYVVIKVDSNNDQITTMDTQNGSYPSWNEKFLIDVPMHVKSFTLEVRCKNFSGHHVVGSARVPMSDFIGGYFPCNYLQFLSYRLRDRYDERNGIINLSVKMMPANNTASSSIPTTYSMKTIGWNYRATMGQKLTYGVVVSVPIHRY
ncbi:hypothetical protein L2E82_45794 [Cichorium intybus]|uniref:Uncharacterized protein n=1 Tax=Cichorium intybus TaxID=13427 RepID=A0ACB8ZTX3_CICIN|nr:hypothetical protein L2E82_45794 [Cichorium intybus]